MLLAGVLMFFGAGLVIGVADDRHERLEAHGAVVDGIVIKAPKPFRGPRSVCFRYVVGGGKQVVTILGSQNYDVGERVKVYVDPEHPASATLPGEQPQSTPAYLVTTMAMILSSLWLFVVGLIELWKGWRQARAASG